MKGKEVRKEINYRQEIIKRLLDKNRFILNEEIVQMSKEIDGFRKKCEHKFDENNICVYCGSINMEGTNAKI